MTAFFFCGGTFSRFDHIPTSLRRSQCVERPAAARHSARLPPPDALPVLPLRLHADPGTGSTELDGGYVKSALPARRIDARRIRHRLAQHAQDGSPQLWTSEMIDVAKGRDFVETPVMEQQAGGAPKRESARALKPKTPSHDGAFFSCWRRKIASPRRAEKRHRQGPKMRAHRALRSGLRRAFRMLSAAASRAENIVSGHAGGGICRAIVR